MYEKDQCIIKGLQTRLSSKAYSDVVFLLDSGVQIFAHKAILSARSTFFFEVFQLKSRSAPCQILTQFKNIKPYKHDLFLKYGENQEVDLISVHEIDSDCFFFVMEYLYTDRLKRLPFEEEKVLDIFNLASLYRLKKLELYVLPGIATLPNCAPKGGIKDHKSSNLEEPSLWKDFSHFYRLCNGKHFANSLPTDRVSSIGFLSDIIFVVDGFRFFAHKVIVSSRSTYFESLFCWNWRESDQREISIPDCPKDAFEIVLEFIYSNRLDIDSLFEALELYKLSQFFGIDEMTCACEEYIVTRNLDVESVCHLWNCAREINAKNLLEDCANFFVTHFLQCSRSPGFLDLERDLLKSALNAGQIDEDEDKMFNVIQLWCQANALRLNCSPQQMIEELLPPKTLFNRRIKQRLIGGSESSEKWMLSFLVERH